MRPKNPERDSPTMVPFGWASEECGREKEGDTEGAGMIKVGSELEGGRGVGVSVTFLDDGNSRTL